MTVHVTRRELIAALAVLASPAMPAAAVEAGAPAPLLELPGLQGPVNSAAWKGKLVVIDFWASWCTPCRRSFPWLNEMQARYGAKGLQVVGVNVDRERADAERFLAEVPARFAIAFDAAGEMPKRFAIKGMPTTVLVGADGRVIKKHTGFRDEDRPGLEAAIVEALGQVAR
ncbi:MAG: TlpA disulfide reductase family protein [Burkholderiaceae bacterium]